MNINEIIWLQNFLDGLTSEGWGNNFDITISTIANPGWSLEINLEDTDLSDKHFDSIKIENSETDWFFCWVEKKKFQGVGGVKNLSNLIKVFINWVER